jgi:BirA family biotin operon repressor/biotin-[acetyl-CoA-carboxylase] ligase
VVIIGIGINISFENNKRPTDIAGAIADYVAHIPTREGLAVAVIEQLHLALSQPLDEVMNAYRDVSATLGQAVRVTTTSGDVIEGVAASVGDDGAIHIESADGHAVLLSGDVEHLRIK